MKKGNSVLAGMGVSVGIGMAVYLLFQLLLALLVVNGVISESQSMGLQIVSGGIAVLLSGLWAVSVLPWGPVPSAMAATLGVGLVTALAGFALYDGLLMTGNTLLRLGVMLAGGLLAGFVGTGGRNRKRRKPRGTKGVRRK